MIYGGLSGAKLILSLLVISPQYRQTVCSRRHAQALLVLKLCTPKPVAPVISCRLDTLPLWCFGRHLETCLNILYYFIQFSRHCDL